MTLTLIYLFIINSYTTYTCGKSNMKRENKQLSKVFLRNLQRKKPRRNFYEFYMGNIILTKYQSFDLYLYQITSTELFTLNRIITKYSSFYYIMNGIYVPDF